MNIAYIVNARIPTEKAHGLQIMKVCEALASRGDTIQLIVPNVVDNAIAQDAFSYYGIDSAFDIRKVKASGRGFRMRSLSFLAALTSLSLPEGTVIITRDPEIAFLFGLRGFEVFYYAHNWPQSKVGLFKLFLRKTLGIICNSKGTEAEFKIHGFSRTLVVPNAVDLSLFESSPDKNESRIHLDIPTDKKVVMYVGHLYAWKGIDVVIGAAESLKNRSDILFVVVGGTDEDIKKYKEIVRVSMLSNVALAGHKQHKEIPSYLNAADILLLPNIPSSKESEYYTSPIKMFEYMASGTPIIASDLPSIREVLNEENATLAKAGDPLALAGTIEIVLSGSAWAATKAEKARQDAGSYSWDSLAQKIRTFAGDQSDTGRSSSKKLVIVSHDGGELANQLWNHVSVLAYALEKGYRLVNHSFFEHARSFARMSEGSLVCKIFSLPYGRSRLRKTSGFIRVWRSLYKVLISRPSVFLNKRSAIYSNDEGEVYYLPPTVPASERLLKLETENADARFFSVSGGVFRNPIGIQTHRKEIVDLMRPAECIARNVDSIMSPLREKYAHVIGVHIRQTDYKTFKGGKYYVSPDRAAEIMREYLGVNNVKAAETCFVIASDEAIDTSVFKGMNVILAKGDVVTDLFTLVSCDALIGSDSTLGHFAAYYGDIPHIIMKNETMDWEYYQGKDRYFANKYLTVMRY